MTELINRAAYCEENRGHSDEFATTACRLRIQLAQEIQRSTRKSDMTALKEANQAIKKAILEKSLYAASIA
jgi:hypothetical protein